MNTYKVTVQRVEYREHTFKIKANNPDEADTKGLEEANDFDFKEASLCHADEEVTSIVKV